MPDLDEFLKNELRRTVRPVDVNDVSSRIDVRRMRRTRVRKVQSMALALVVLAGTIGGVAVLSAVFRKGTNDQVGDVSPFPIVPKTNGVIVATQQVRSGHLRLVSVNPDGSEHQALGSQLTGDPWLPAWSPDGTKLAVAVFPFDAPRAIWIMDANGANATKIVEGENVSRPSWSPDGGQIAVAVDTKDGSSIHIMDADGSNDRVIGDTLHGKDYFSASFSPDGTQLIFDRGTDSAYGIFVMNVDGSDVRSISSAPSDSNPSWSPDGSQIVFTRQEEGAESDIYVMDADGTNVRRLTDDGPGVTNLNAEFSPDGQRIVYVAGVTGGPGSIVVMNTDGSRPVTILDEGVIGISWQPLPSTATPAPAVADLGLGFPVCDVRSIQADFDGNGTIDTASVATKMSDVGGCPQADAASNILGIDLDGDGKIDAEFGPISCGVGCKPFMAIDLDGDGADELLVEQVGGAVLGLVPYIIVGFDDVAADGPGIGELVVAPPGDPENGLVAGGPLTFYVGGDEGFSASLDCHGSGEDRVLVATTGELDSIDQPTTWTIHRTTFRLGSQGFDVVDTKSFDQPVGDVITPGSQQETNLCGIPFPPNPVFETP